MLYYDRNNNKSEDFNNDADKNLTKFGKITKNYFHADDNDIFQIKM